MRPRTTGLLAAALVLLLVAPAGAAPAWRACNEGPGVRCATVRVPLDRAGAVPGSVPLRIARLRRAGAPVLVYLSGGPGAAGISEMLAVVSGIPALTTRFTVIGLDQRGTGRSGPIRCPEMQRDERVRSTLAAARCAARLGVRRAFYTTRDSVEDLEAVRAALGVPRMTLFGVSYGTGLALQYARAHPDRVERLLLDSVVDPDDADPFGVATLRAVPATLRALCPARCRGLTADPGADLAALVAGLRASPLRGRTFDVSGRARRGTVDPTSVFDLLLDADYFPPLRAAIPAAVRAALDNRDPAPLLRLQALGAPPVVPEAPSEFSSGRYAAICEETPLPWDRTAPPAVRLAAARAGAAALGLAAFAPFDAGVALADEIELCLRWPVPFRPPPPALGPYPDVPALLLQGGEDLRTPPATSAAVAARLPRARLVVVPGVGHAPVSADPSGCARRRLARFLAGRRVAGRCPRVPAGVPPVEVPPVRFGGLERVRGLPARPGRTLRAVRATLVDVVGAASLSVPGGGLRGGRYGLAGRDLILRRVVVVPGVRVTGRIGPSGAAVLRVSGGAAAPGRLRLGARGRVRGRLGGRAVDARLRAGAIRVPSGFMRAFARGR